MDHVTCSEARGFASAHLVRLSSSNDTVQFILLRFKFLILTHLAVSSAPPTDMCVLNVADMRPYGSRASTKSSSSLPKPTTHLCIIIRNGRSS